MYNLFDIILSYKEFNKNYIYLKNFMKILNKLFLSYFNKLFKKDLSKESLKIYTKS